jgi:uncharacterized membrane protein
MVKIFLLVLLSEILTATGQVLFKHSTNSLESYSLRGAHTHIRFLSEVLSKPSLWAGFTAMAAGLVVWLMALSEGDLSLIFSLGSIQYIMILFLAHKFLGERINPVKLAGTILVMIGIVFIIIG